MADKIIIDIDKARRLTLSDVNDIVRGVVETVFLTDDETGGTNFAPQYRELNTVFFELCICYPDSGIHKLKYDEFFDRYTNGEFDEALDYLRSLKQIQFLERAISAVVEARLKYYCGGELANSVRRIVDNVNAVVEQQAAGVGDLDASDIQGFIKSFSEFVGKTDTDSLVSSLLDKQKSASKPRKSAKAAKPASKAE